MVQVQRSACCACVSVSIYMCTYVNFPTTRPLTYDIQRVKKQPLKFLDITLANEDQFSKFFHWRIRKENLYVDVVETSTSP